MGGVFTAISEYFFARPEIEFRLSIIGFQNAGKSTILQRIKFGDEAQGTVPTIGYDLQELSIKNVKLKVYDLSGQENLRQTWKHYYESINGLIFVIDSTCLDDNKQ